MAEAPATATRPSRARKAAAPVAAKSAPAKAAPAKAPTAEKVDVTRFTVELEHGGSTKSFEKFVFPDNMKGVVVGSVYAPLGTEAVKVLIIGAGDTAE